MIFLGIAALGPILFGDWLAFDRALDLGGRQLLASTPALLTMVIGVAHVSGRTQGLRPVAIVITVCISIAAPICSGVILAAAFERGRTFAHDRTTGAEKVDRRIKSVGLANIRLCRCAPDGTERLRLPGGFSTRVSIFDGGGEDRPRGVVIAHGNTWLGSDLSTYRVLARGLADRGYVVATVDFPGFGKSDDPFGHGPSALADAYDRPATLAAAIDWLAVNTEVDPTDVTVLGHSGGVDWAMRVGHTHPAVSRVAVMVAPPPPVIEEGLENGTPEYAEARSAYFSHRFAEQYQFVYGKSVPGWYRWELAQPDGRYEDDVFATYTKPQHKPLLLILGERDQPDGHASVRKVFGSLAEPKQLLFLRRSDHYLNSAQSLGLFFYEKAVMQQLIDGLDAWIEGATTMSGRDDGPSLPPA